MVAKRPASARDLILLGVPPQAAVVQADQGPSCVVYRPETGTLEPLCACGLVPVGDHLEAWFAVAENAPAWAVLAAVRGGRAILRKVAPGAIVRAWQAPGAVAFDRLALLFGLVPDPPATDGWRGATREA